MELLRAARRRAGLSQRELARRAGTSQAMVARIESGAQSPGIATLERLMRACDSDLVLAAAGAPAEPAAVPPAAPIPLMVWSVGQARCAFPLAAVGEVLPEQPLRRLPGQPHGFGTIAGRDGVLAAVDAAVLLGVEATGPRRFVTVATPAGTCAVLVGATHGTVTASPVPPPPLAGAAAYVAGVALIDADVVAILDPAAFCRPPAHAHARATAST